MNAKQDLTMSRRSFFSSALLAGAGVAGAASLPEIAFADEEAVVAEEDWLGAEPVINDDEVISELTADVVVVGVSDSGSIAVRSAVEAGASVVAIEKGQYVQACGSDIAVPNGPIQARYGRENAVDINELVMKHQEECLHHTKEGIVRRFCNEMGEVFEWILEADPDVLILDTIFDDVPDDKKDNYIIPNRYPMHDESYDYHSEAMPTFPVTVKFPALKTLTTANYEKAVEEGDVTGLFGHAGRKLIMENGRCVGIYAEDIVNGGYVKVNATKGVILCTGDYKNNQAMLDHFTPQLEINGNKILSILMDANGQLACMGEGHRMGVWAGARLQEHPAVMIHHMGGGAGADGRGVMGINGYLQLNLDGKRFMNEDMPGQQLENQIEKQRGRTTYQFFDAAWPEQVKFFPAAHGMVMWCLDETPLNHPTNTNWRTLEDIDVAVEEGRCLKADTLEELVALIEGIDQEQALASIARYNELAAAGEDADFGKDSRRLFALENPPFYACQLTPAMNLANMDGLESDEFCHTFDEDRNVIPGLYVAGNTQGNRFAMQYPISMPGCSVGFALFYGYVAGQSAAQEL